MKALLAALKERFGDKMTAEVQTAVEEAYELDLADEVSGLKEKNSQLILRAKALREQMAAGGGGDTAKLLAELDDLKDRSSTELAAKDRELKKLARDLEAATKLAAAESQAVKALTIDGGLSEALAAVNIGKQYLPAAKALIREQVQVKAEGDKRAAFVGDKPLLDYVKEWAASDDGKPYVVLPGNAGGGAGGSTPPNGAPGGKKILRADFMAKSPEEQLKLAKDGYETVDAL